VGPSQFRRLTVDEYERTVKDLVGVAVPAVESARPSPDNRARGFDNQAEAQSVHSDAVFNWYRAAESIAGAAVADLPRLMACSAPTDVGRCAESFMPAFAQRAFRRPLTSTEAKRFQDFYNLEGTRSSPKRAIELFVHAVLMSPSFLFLVEGGSDDKTRPLDAYELATRMSYALWRTMPDQALFDAAAGGRLHSAADVTAQAQRMLADPRAAHVVRDFYGQWADAYEPDAIELAAGFDVTMADGAVKEIWFLVDDWFRNGSGLVPELFTTNKTLVNTSLARFYGLPKPAAGKPVEATLPATQRSGLLTRAVFLGSHGPPPTRGDFVLGRVICRPVPAPPPLPDDAVDPKSFRTTRERFEVHAQQPCARACHGILDPVGFVFENYDRNGIFRTVENGVAVNASTVVAIPGADGINGPVTGAVQFSERVARSKELFGCQAHNWFTYTMGRVPGEGDSCAVAAVADSLQASGGDLRQALVSLVLTDAFRSVRPARKKEKAP
jgi:hypothetical protein